MVREAAGNGTTGPSGAAEAVLACPHCGGALRRAGRTWRCGAGHAFDVARQGYVNLLPGPSPHAGDSAAMLDARARVLGAGHLDAVTDALIDALRTHDLPGDVVVEVGAGTGHHLARVTAATARAGVAVDVSTAAARRAARASPGVTAVVADAWGRWPLLDGAAAAVLHVFAPRNPPEAIRVLSPGGLLVVTVPAPDHLAELRGPLGLLSTADPERKLPSEPLLAPAGTMRVRTRRRMTRDDVHALVAMGPSARHVDGADLADRVAGLPEPLDVSVAVDVVVWRRLG